MTQVIGGAQAVAYELFERVCYAEGKDIGLTLNAPAAGSGRAAIGSFSTYAECLAAVQPPRHPDAKIGFEAGSDPSGHRYVAREAILASDPI